MKSKLEMDMVDVIKPMHYLSIMFFIAPFFAPFKKTPNNKRTFKFSKLIFAANAIALLFYIQHEGLSMYMYLTMPFGISMIDTVSIFVVMSYYALILVISSVICRRAIRFLNDLIEIDEIFESMSLNPNNASSKWIVRAFAILEMMSFTSIFLYCIIMGDYGFGMTAFVYRNALSHVRMTILSQFASFAYLIYYRFDILNDQLRAYKTLYIDASPMLRKHLVSSIKTCCLIHDRLVASAKKLNYAFEIQLTITYISIFVFIIPVFNALCKSPIFILALIINLLNFIKALIFMIGVMLVALVCTKTKNKVNHSLKIIIIQIE